MDAFGPLVSPPMVEREVLRVLKSWANDYIAAIAGASRGDRAALDPVRGWERVGRFPTLLPEYQMPYVALVSSGTVDPPRSDGDTYSQRFAINVGVIVGAGGSGAEQDAHDLAGDYATALTAALVHKGVTSPLISDVLPRGVQLGERPPIADLSVAAAVSVLWVDVDNVLTLYGGPAEPSLDPVSAPPALSQVEEIDLTINAEDPT